jgi:gamma-glutamylcyclotransferase (GGCT)/AIG2-like uncharacterized protein YtfP/predicted glutamine amidotransferase
MCGQTGIIFGRQSRGKGSLPHLVDLFTRLLLLGEERGYDATGVALLKMDGDCSIVKAPVSASEFVHRPDFRRLLCFIDHRARVLMGHTRKSTRGGVEDSENNHPIKAGSVIGTHNGTIYNADSLFRLLDLPRHGEVDSEIIFRIADATLVSGRIQLSDLRSKLALCRGQMSAVLASTLDPEAVVLLKGNRPIELRYHPVYDVVLYASDKRHMDATLGERNGWQRLALPRMSIITLHCENLIRPYTEPLGFISQGSGTQALGGYPVTEEGDEPTLVRTVQNEPLRKHTRVTLRLFVYGTLKRGYWNHDRFCKDAVSIEPATVLGRLYELPSGIPVLEVPDSDILALGTDYTRVDLLAQQRALVPRVRTESSDKWQMIHGELMTFDDPEDRLRAIDYLEGFCPGTLGLYRRALVPVYQDVSEPIAAWCYVLGMRASSMRKVRRDDWQPSCSSQG